MISERLQHAAVVSTNAGEQILRDPAYDLLFVAVTSGDARSLRIALHSNIDINARFVDYGQTALHIAALNSARSCIAIIARIPRCDFLIKDKSGYLASDISYLFARDARTGGFLCQMEARQMYRNDAK